MRVASKQPCVVIRRTHEEASKKGSLVTTYKITLRSPEGDKHELVSNSKSLWDEYPVGAEREVTIKNTQQMTLAVAQIRRGQEETEETEEEA